MSSINMFMNLDKCGDRKEDDFYPTPWEPTQALMESEADALERYPVIYECACGDGAMAEVIKENGHDVLATDLIDRGYGKSGVDFLKLSLSQSYPGALITNPPFSLSEGFIRKAMMLRFGYVALLLKANYWNVDCRRRLWRDYPPSRIYALTWRVDFTGDGNNHFDCIWCVWDEKYSGETIAKPPLQRPKARAHPYLF